MNAVNSGYVAELYEQFSRDPASVEREWRALFESGGAGFAPAPAPGAAEQGNGTGAVVEPTPPQAESPAPEAPTSRSLPPGATPIKGPAARLAQNMTSSLAVPTATSFRDISVSVLEASRSALNAQLAPRKISFTHLIGWAIVRAASDQPSMTHAFLEADGTAYRVDPGAVHLGLAVDVERPDGSRFLIVPVIRGADGMDFAGFVARYEELVEKARANRLAPDDVAGATMTLTNPGTLGTTASVPRLMPGQGTIVATGAIRSVADQRLMTLTSTYDHRVIQGAESGAFLRRIDGLLAGDDDFYGDVFAATGATPTQAAPAAAPAAPPAPAAPAAPAQGPASGPAAAASGDDLKAVAAAVALVRAYRSFGHLAAKLDPLGSPPPGDPALDPEPLGLTQQAMERIPAELLHVDVPGATLADALPALQATYCGSIAYEVEHIASHDERVWLRRVIESGEHRRALTGDEQRGLLERLSAVEGLERFLHRAYLGQKRFSIEGLDVMVPMLDQVLSDAAESGSRDAVIGMAHRGRLNVL
ncbi:MAG TPA: 2-oxo acid dehydrogenase subunit E2, partial [Candidatus Limnocylindrales bacterium]|nr:2-oxo acid dehydrogenase subunit E2 [Candidatus Limnocylindrales bacterium]